MSTIAATPTHVRAVVAPVCAAGALTVVAACVSYGLHPHTSADVAALAGLFLCMALAERFPVPVEGVDAGGVTLGFVFAVATILLFGWEAGVIVAAGAPTVTHLLGHRPPLRVAYNGSMFALSALAGAVAIQGIPERSVGSLIVRLALCAFVYNWIVNLVLISAVLAASSGKSFFSLIWGNAKETTAPFALMASAALMLVVLWERSPALSIALVGPLLAIALYQRSTFAALKAMQLALTDPLTGLGNHRHFHERLQRALATAERDGDALSLCLVDIDDFKQVNDRHGHPLGDRVLRQVASRLRQGGESFRLGGDEFAVLLPKLDRHEAMAVARSIVERVACSELEQVGRVTVSAGVATYPVQGVGRDELIRVADSALYWAKEDGKDRARSYEPRLVDLDRLDGDRTAGYLAAAGFARTVDGRDAYTGEHSQRVADLAARIARRLELDDADVELVRVAASLHDVGKLAIPEEILRKPGELNETERLVLQRHPQIGHRMLENLGAEPIADWVLHHHERWDGSGYPHRLRGEEIPFGSRIIFVADAYDAMTSDRVYRDALSPEQALDELGRCAGTQFDPVVVDAVADELGVATHALAS